LFAKPMVLHSVELGLGCIFRSICQGEWTILTVRSSTYMPLELNLSSDAFQSIASSICSSLWSLDALFICKSVCDGLPSCTLCLATGPGGFMDAMLLANNYDVPTWEVSLDDDDDND
jgi:hypothetical protein